MFHPQDPKLIRWMAAAVVLAAAIVLDLAGASSIPVDCLPDAVVQWDAAQPALELRFGAALLPGIVLGPPGSSLPINGSTSVASLGNGGSVVLAFHDLVIEDGPGPDFIVFENPFFVGVAPATAQDDYLIFAEPGIVEVTLEVPRQVEPDDPLVRRGRQSFGSIGCASCHAPVMQTDALHLPIAFPEVPRDPGANVFMTVNLIAGPGFRPNASGGVRVLLYSDLKRHDMGPGLSETTGGDLDPYFVTPRLWGISDTAPYLHDGRAPTLREAILAHGGEGQFAADGFAALAPTAQEELLTFLDSLRAPLHPARGIDRPVRRGQ